MEQSSRNLENKAIIYGDCKLSNLTTILYKPSWVSDNYHLHWHNILNNKVVITNSAYKRAITYIWKIKYK